MKGVALGWERVDIGEGVGWVWKGDGLRSSQAWKDSR